MINIAFLQNVRFEWLLQEPLSFIHEGSGKSWRPGLHWNAVKMQDATKLSLQQRAEGRDRNPSPRQQRLTVTAKRLSSVPRCGLNYLVLESQEGVDVSGFNHLNNAGLWCQQNDTNLRGFRRCSKTLSSSDAFKKFIQLGIKTRFYICKPLLDVQNQPVLHHFN